MSTKTRILYLEINSCEECPYCQYDSYYNTYRDSCYRCEHELAPKSVIVEDWQIKKYKDDLKYYNEHPILQHDMKKPQYPLKTIPDWCPLPKSCE